jgi:uncharacterized protein (TIGR03435 family)
MRSIRARSILFSLLLATTLFAQAPPQFEVVSIRPAPDQGQRADFGIHISGSQVRMTYTPVKDYIALAYQVKPSQINAPDWTTQDHFDIAAKLPDGASADQVPQMLQRLLEERFELKLHHESKEFPVFALMAGKSGAKLQPSPPPIDLAEPAPGTVNVAVSGSGAGVAMDLGGGASFLLANNKLEMRRVTMPLLADGLTRMTDRPVVDMTGFTGVYDLTLELAPEEYQAAMVRSALNAGVILQPRALLALERAPIDPFSSALQKYGLTLESRRAPLDVIVIDSIRRTPIEN